MRFTYRSKGSADEWSTDVIEAETKKDALKLLDEIYGVTRNETGEQTNSDMIRVEITQSNT